MKPQRVYVVTHDTIIVGIYEREADAEAIMRLTVLSKMVPAAWTDIERHYIRDAVAAEDEIMEMETNL